MRAHRSRKSSRRAEAAHPAQQRGAGVLERQVEVRGDAGRGRDDLDEVRAHLGGLQVGHAHPVDAGHVREPRQQAHERAGAARQVLAVGRRVLAHQHQLAHALHAEPRGLGDDVVRGAGDERAAEGRDRAERAAPVAARGELEVGDRARPRAACGGSRRGRARARRRPSRSTGRERQQGAPVDGRVRGRGVAAEHVGEPLGRARGSRRSRARRRPRAGCRPAPCRSARPGSRRRRPSPPRRPTPRARCRSSPSWPARRTRRC